MLSILKPPLLNILVLFPMSLIFSNNKFDNKCWFLRCYIWYPCVHTELIWVLCVLKEYSLSLVLPSLEYLQEYFGEWFNPRNVWVLIKIYWMGKKINTFGLIISALKRVENQEWEYNHIFLLFFLKILSKEWKCNSSQCHYNSVGVFSAFKNY